MKMVRPLPLVAFAISTVLTLGPCAPASANQQPRGMATDGRIKLVPYDADDVVTIHGSHLVATNIQLNPDESIVSIDNGDPVAWNVAVNKAVPYIIALKPILPSSSTNMMVVTTQREYQFHLEAGPGDNADSGNATYLVRFKYPEEEKAQLQSELNRFAGQMNNGAPVNMAPLNNNYSFYGSKAIAPIQAVDNGKFTLFKFPERAPIPAIFSVGSDSQESIVNFSAQGNTVYIQGVHHLYTLRNGKDVTSVYNDARM